MKKIISVFLPLLFVFISCFPWDSPEAGNLFGYEIVFDKSNVSNGYIDLNISGSLDSKHKNPGNYGIFCWIFADRTNESNCDHYFKSFEFIYE